MGGGEYELDCPACEITLFVVFGEHGRLATSEDHAIKADVTTTPLLPALPDELGGLGGRLHGVSIEAGQNDVAATITHVFGRATCPECHTVFSVADQVRPD